MCSIDKRARGTSNEILVFWKKLKTLQSPTNTKRRLVRGKLTRAESRDSISACFRMHDRSRAQIITSRAPTARAKKLALFGEFSGVKHYIKRAKLGHICFSVDKIKYRQTCRLTNTLFWVRPSAQKVYKRPRERRRRERRKF